MKLLPHTLPTEERSAMDCAVGVCLILGTLLMGLTCVGLEEVIRFGKDVDRIVGRAALIFGGCSLLVLIPAAPILIRAMIRNWRHNNRSREVFGLSEISLLTPVVEGQSFTVRFVQPLIALVVIERAELSLAFMQEFEWQTQDPTGEPDIIPKHYSEQVWGETRTTHAKTSLPTDTMIELQETFVMPAEVPLREEAERRYQDLSGRSYFLDAGPRDLFWRVHIRIVLADGFVFQVAYKLVPDDAPNNPE